MSFLPVVAVELDDIEADGILSSLQSKATEIFTEAGEVTPTAFLLIDKGEGLNKVVLLQPISSFGAEEKELFELAIRKAMQQWLPYGVVFVAEAYTAAIQPDADLDAELAKLRVASEGDQDGITEVDGLPMEEVIVMSISMQGAHDTVWMAKITREGGDATVGGWEERPQGAGSNGRFANFFDQEWTHVHQH